MNLHTIREFHSFQACKTKPYFTFTLTFSFLKIEQPGKRCNYTGNLHGCRGIPPTQDVDFGS